jgi:uncharacterized membrane protein
MRSASWQNPKVALTLLLVFLCGAAAGAVGMRFTSVAAAAKPVPAWKDGGRDVTLQRFKKELKLNGKQAAELEEVLDDFMKYYQTLQAQMDEVRANGKERILGVLDDSQKEKFNQMMGELQKQQIR